jgi:hypothetical protein
MQPNDSFWEGVGAGLSSADGTVLVVCVALVAVLFVVVRWGLPTYKELREKRLDIERMRAESDAERVRANQALADAQAQTNILVDGMRQSLDASTAHTDVLVAELRASRERSREMSEDVEHIVQTTDHTDGLVEDIHRHLFREGTD